MSYQGDRAFSTMPSSSSRSASPALPVQPDHFYGLENPQHLLPSPNSSGRTWLDPQDDPLAQRGIPVFKPTMEEFADFEAYLNKIQCWGMKSGIVKVIPPKEWTDALPSITNQLGSVKLRNPIEQHMFGRGGLFRQENVEKRRILSVREWTELCAKEELRAPGVDDIGLHARATNGSAKPRIRRARKKRESETAEPDPDAHAIKEEEEEALNSLAHNGGSTSLASPPDSAAAASPPSVDQPERSTSQGKDNTMASTVDASSPKPEQVKGDDDLSPEEQTHSQSKRSLRKSKEAGLAARAEKDKAFLETFDPHSDWLPPNTTPFDYTPDFCRELERRYWRNCGLGRPAWYGADMAGSLFTEETKCWNVANLHSTLTRLLPASSRGLPGVNTPYLYFGMWRATFAWHVEDMDLFSINYVHFGAPKYWYAIPQARAPALEQTMRGYFPKDVSNCSQFLRHKSFLASPTLLSSSSCRPNTVVQHAGEFIITFPKGYHAGFNLGFNCAESVNFALDSWLEIGRKAKACGCVNFSVRIDVDQLLRDREAERLQAEETNKARPKHDSKSSKEARTRLPRKRPHSGEGDIPHLKKQKIAKASKSLNSSSDASSSKSSKPTPAKVTLKLPPKPKEPDTFPCCLCISMSSENLLRAQDPPLWRLPQSDGAPAVVDPSTVTWMAHENCANVIPETWVDEVEVGDVREDGTRAKERVVFGVDAIVKDRWNLKCTACTKTRHKAHGAPIQCTKGKCPKAFHVSCAREGSNNIVYKELREVEKEVVLLDPQGPSAVPDSLARPLSSQLELPEGVSFSGNGSIMNSDAVPGPSTQSSVGQGDIPGPQVLKLIRKLEVQVLCSQHNPAVAEAKRANKHEKIRNELLALPPMSRIKLRVSAGVFEVSLIRVIEESLSVEVLWDRGVKREFKWGSVVFGNTDGLTVGQKPSEAAPESEALDAGRSSSHTRLSFPLSEATAPAATTLSYQRQTNTPILSPFPMTPSTAPQAAPAAAPYYQPQPPVYPTQPPSYQYTATTWRYQYTPSSMNPPTYPAAGSSTTGYPYATATRQPYENSASYPLYSGYSYQGPKPVVPSHSVGQAGQHVSYYGSAAGAGNDSSQYTQQSPSSGQSIAVPALAAPSQMPSTSSSVPAHP